MVGKTHRVAAENHIAQFAGRLTGPDAQPEAVSFQEAGFGGSGTNIAVDR
jgi:hypothetical protein